MGLDFVGEYGIEAVRKHSHGEDTSECEIVTGLPAGFEDFITVFFTGFESVEHEIEFIFEIGCGFLSLKELCLRVSSVSARNTSLGSCIPSAAVLVEASTSASLAGCFFTSRS